MSESEKWHVLKQYAEGKLENGDSFSVELIPGLFNDILREIISKQIGKKVKEVQIVFR